MPRDTPGFLLLLVLWTCLGSVAALSPPYSYRIERWRQQRETDLKAEDGWLSVSGLFWLKAGQTRIGSDPSNDLVLPAHAPASVGTVTLQEGNVRFQAAPGVTITRDQKPFESGEIHSDADEHPDSLAVGDIKLILIKRGRRLAIRLKDNRSPLRKEFAGLRWYPINADWRIEARFVAYPSPTKLVMDTVVGETEVEDSPGDVVFQRDGKEYRLQAARLKDGRLWFVFRDKTSGRTTHGGARQLYAGPPKDGVVVLDFNQAVNLPCAYIPFATCPLAPPQNRLALAIEAGELKYEPHPAAGPSTGDQGR